MKTADFNISSKIFINLHKSPKHVPANSNSLEKVLNINIFEPSDGLGFCQSLDHINTVYGVK